VSAHAFTKNKNDHARENSVTMNIRHWLAHLACLAWMGMAANTQAAESYSFGVVPQFEQRKLFAIWKPIIDEVAKRTGLELNLVATLTVPDFEREIAAGRYDFVYANPYHILRESTRQGYIPLVRDNQPLRGILVVRKDSQHSTPADLAGQTLAIPSFNALGASLLLRADLEQLLKVSMTPLNVKSHSSVYLHVVNGLTAAGGGVEKTLQEQDPVVKDALRVLYTTREMPSHPVAAHPRVPEQARKKIQQAFIELGSTEVGRRLLAGVPMAEAVPTSILDYQPMSRWGLDKYWVNQ
jgi:phosphonate transport system substrate-binding protein